MRISLNLDDLFNIPVGKRCPLNTLPYLESRPIAPSRTRYSIPFADLGQAHARYVESLRKGGHWLGPNLFIELFSANFGDLSVHDRRLSPEPSTEFLVPSSRDGT